MDVSSAVGNARLELRGISKSFSGVTILDNVNFNCSVGEVHALVGENGAGKSTLMKILSGVYQPDGGTIIFENCEVEFDSPRDAQSAGISMIHQELSLANDMNVMENIFMGHLPKSKLGFVDYQLMPKKTSELLAVLGAQDIYANDKISELSASQRQIVEIAKALSLNAKILIMDEPTSSLSLTESANLLKLIGTLREKGMTIVYISHRLEEVFSIADRITVLRDGSTISTKIPHETSPNEIVAMMVGRKAPETKIIQDPPQKEIILDVKGLTQKGKFQDISFSLHKGEILGVAGLVGAGRSDVAMALFGDEHGVKGTVVLNGKKISLKSPVKAIRAGIALVPEDRKLQSLFLSMSVKENIVMASAGKNREFALINSKDEEKKSKDYFEHLRIRANSLDQEIQYLSGGNQQKAIIARWLLCEPQVLILDEPTRGIDVGAKEEIYNLIRSLAEKGVGVLLISSELPEILMLSHKIIVMREGRIAGKLERGEATQEKVMLIATGQMKEN